MRRLDRMGSVLAAWSLDRVSTTATPVLPVAPAIKTVGDILHVRGLMADQ